MRRRRGRLLLYVAVYFTKEFAIGAGCQEKEGKSEVSSWHDEAAAACQTEQGGREEERDAQCARSLRSIFGTNELSFGAALISTAHGGREETHRPKVDVGERGATEGVSRVALDRSEDATHSPRISCVIPGERGESYQKTDKGRAKERE